MNSLHVVFSVQIGNTLSCIIEYHNRKGIHEIRDFENEKTSYPLILESDLNFQVLGRLIPGFGSNLVSTMSGIYQFSFSSFILISVITNGIGEFILAYGRQAISLLGRK
jgi:membrane protein YqaA with SNARE-associated domain